MNCCMHLAYSVPDSVDAQLCTASCDCRVHPPTVFFFTCAVHFWAPTFKWGISLANIADMQRPADKISVPQQCGMYVGQWGFGS